MKPFAAVALAALVAWGVAFAPWPDDWDGLGFLASIGHFDLAAFSPHPPGYPVYVALLKLAALATPDPISAARVVAVFAGLVTLGGVAELLRGADAKGEGTRRAGVAALGAGAVCATPLVFRAFSGVGSEAPALACAAVAAMGVASAQRGPTVRAVLVGAGVGLGLGVRVSWAPFYVPFIFLLPSPLRLRAFAFAALACLSWGIPLVLMTGPAALASLARTHVAGHMTVWGGTVMTNGARGSALVRDVVIDGLGGGDDPLGILILVALALSVVAASHHWLRSTDPAERRAQASVAAILAGPYLVWVCLGQNLGQQPRHVLPLVALLAYALARAALATGASPARRTLLTLLAALVIGRTSVDAYARRTIPPPGAQLLAYLREHAAGSPPAATAVFAGASSRFLDGTEWQARARAAGTLGDALLAITRMDRLPRTLLVTSELAGLEASRASLTELASLCRPERLDRRLPCMRLYAVDMRAATSR